MNIEIKRYKNNNTFDNLEYYYVPIINGKEYSLCFETEDLAMLGGIGIKYEGVNSKFVTYASRMLNIESKWNE